MELTSTEQNKEKIKKLYLIFDVDPKCLTRIDFFKLIDTLKSILISYERESIIQEAVEKAKEYMNDKSIALVTEIFDTLNPILNQIDIDIDNLDLTIAGVLSNVNTLSTTISNEIIDRQNSDLELKVQEKTTWESTNIPTDNTTYNLGTIPSLTITSLPTSTKYGIIIYFTSGSTATTLSYPTNSKWMLDTVPVIETNTDYYLSILDGVFNLIKLNTL